MTGTAPADRMQAPERTPAVRRWTITATSGHTASGYLPPWAITDPSETGVPLSEFGAHLAAVNHYSPFEGLLLHVETADRGFAEEEILRGSIECGPYSPHPAARIPVVNIAVSTDCWLTALDPEDLSDLAAKLRAQADRLDHVVRPALIAARTDWATRHSAHDELSPTSCPVRDRRNGR